MAEAQPLPAEAAVAREPSGETLIMLGGKEAVEKARVWVAVVLEMERFVREGRRERREPEAWRALLAQQRAAREGYYAAVRSDLGLPPGHGARTPLPSVPAA